MPTPPTGAALVALARQIATRAHAGQRDKAGHPYLGHPARVADRVAASGGDERAVAAAWLHDVLEDTDTTADDLLDQGVLADVVAAVVALTHTADEPPERYFARINADPLALQVKHADLADNTDPARTAELDATTAARLAAKYVRWAQLLAPWPASTDLSR
ncbi:MAG: HD domain-containing protein [Cellulomonas sp.]|jgi:(p)ppGpp synthase/HD superfamily hydrolase|nr:HD domain-containing protein [Cellulomonas sp.]